MTILYIVSDRAEAGKTALCATLASQLTGLGRRVALLKPIATSGLDVSDDPDAGSYKHLLGLSIDGWPFWKGEGPLSDEIESRAKVLVNRLSPKADIVIVEGSTALSANEHRRLAETMDAKILAVVAHDPGIPSETLTSWITQLGTRTIGAVVNGLTRYRGLDDGTTFMLSTAPNVITTFGVVPEDRRLLGVSVVQLAQHLDGRFISGEDTSDALVEHLMVGGMGMDPGEHYFGVLDSKAVIVRGDRPDLQMAALKTPTACIVMTKDIEPIEYVQYEAREEQVPVIIVETDTLETMEALNGLMHSARFDHPLKLARYAELANQHINLPALYGSLGLSE